MNSCDKKTFRIISRKSYLCTSDKGATLPEFAIALPAILMIILFLVDAGMLLFRYALLTDATATVARVSPTTLGQAQANGTLACSNLDDFLSQAESSVNSALQEGMNFDVSFQNLAGVPYQLVAIQGTYDFNCILCEFFTTGDPHLTNTSVLVIERQFSCT